MIPMKAYLKCIASGCAFFALSGLALTGLIEVVKAMMH